MSDWIYTKDDELPDKWKDVIVTTYIGDELHRVEIAYRDDTGKWCDGDEGNFIEAVDGVKVIAWQPFPNPAEYKGE